MQFTISPGQPVWLKSIMTMNFTFTPFSLSFSHNVPGALPCGVPNGVQMNPHFSPRSNSYYRLSTGTLSKAAFVFLCLCCLLAASPLWGLTTVYLPAPGPLSFLPVAGASNATPIVITSNQHGLSNGAAIWCQNIGGNLAANGYFSVSQATTNTFQLTYLYYGGNVS